MTMNKTETLVGEGSFGEVYKRQTRQNIVARKYLKPGSGEIGDQLKRRFAREVRVQAQIKHPNVVPVLRYDLDVERPWFEMPYADGTFDDAVKESLEAGAIDPNAWGQLLAGVGELHRMNFVHRDIKPANILRFCDTWKISDLGLVMARDTTILTNQERGGTENYMAPEQYESFRDVCPRADIYALGAILHDCVSETLRVPMSHIVKDIPYGVVIDKATATLSRRIPTVAVFQDLLNREHALLEYGLRPDALNQLNESPGDRETWASVSRAVESNPDFLKVVGEVELEYCRALDEELFKRLARRFGDWVGDGSFIFGYCDTLARRGAYFLRNLCDAGPSIDVLLGLLKLGVSHNRWYVMRTVLSALGPNADKNLIDRMVIEISIDERIAEQLSRIHSTLGAEESQWHPKLIPHISANPNIAMV